MTDQHPPSENQPADQDRIQDKADILENNLFSAISKQEDPVVIRFQVDRETAPDPVIIKALMQLFPRINIKAPKILLLIRKLLLRRIPPGEELKVQKQVIDFSGSENPELRHLAVFLRILVRGKILAVEFKGVPPVPSKDGAIAEAFFDYKSCPGVVDETGVIDFREINKYPIVKAGDNLFFITPEVQGRSGMSYDGKVIPVPQAMPMTFDLKDGVDIVESQNTGGKSRGYFLRASKTGAVLMSRINDKISGLEIRDALDVKRLDYSTGNIGTNFICPISMKIDTICSGFRIRARGTVEVGELEGGEVETDSHATIHSAHPDSKVTAKKDVVAHFSRSSKLSSLKGRVSIAEELVDSEVDGVEIIFEKSRGILSGNTLDAEHFELKDLYFCGENRVYFGRRLFNEKHALLEARKKLKEDNLARDEKEKELMESLQRDIKQLTKILKRNPLLLDALKTFIMAAQTMDYKTMYRELGTIGQTMNTKEVINITKLLDTLKKLPGQKEIAKAKDKALLARIAETEEEMTRMKLNIEGFLRRAGTLKIFTPDTAKEEEEGKPAVFIESKQERDTFIKFHGTYTPKQGFQIIQA
ncbi:MAG: FapA family protein [Desulfobacterales bacterium]|nr:FapA family protein [Desulfobacterales bacterium]